MTRLQTWKKLFGSARRRDSSVHAGNCVFACLVAATTLAISPFSIAQEELNDDRTIEERRDNTQTISETAYKRLSAVHELLGEDKLAEALHGLRKMEKSNLNDYEKALVKQTYGFVYVRQDKERLAIANFEESLALDALPSEAQQGMLYSLAGLYAAGEQYLKAIETMREWFRYEADPAPDAYIMIASSFTELQRFDDALPYVQKAIEKSEKPRENWYLLELAIYFEKQQYRNAVRVAKKMLQYWPDKPTYWEILFGAYLELGEDKNALDVIMVAYSKGWVSTESKIMSVVQLNLALDIPFVAGSILEREIAAGSVDGTKKNLDILLQAWLSAREFERAIATIDKIAPLSEDGEYYMRKAGIYNELGEWQNVADSAKQAVDAGLEKPAKAYMLIGMAYSELDQFTDSINAFRRARKLSEPGERKAVDAWIAFVEEKISLANAKVASAN